MHYSYSEASKTATIYLKVKAASKESNIGELVDIEGRFFLKITIGEIAEGGKANLAIIKMLAKIWKLKQNQLQILKGHTQSIKLLAVENITKPQMDELLLKYVRVS